MSDQNNDQNNDQSPKEGGQEQGRAPLTLKPRLGGSVPSGTVKQSFSHGRSKTVVVETKRRRDGVGTVNAPSRPTVDLNIPRAAPKPVPANPTPQAQRPQGGTSGGLRDAELEARRRAIEAAAQVEKERRDAEESAAYAKREAALRAQALEMAKSELESKQTEPLIPSPEARQEANPIIETQPKEGEPVITHPDSATESLPEPIKAPVVDVKRTERKPLKSDQLPNFGQRVRAQGADRRPEGNRPQSTDGPPRGPRREGAPAYGQRNDQPRPERPDRPVPRPDQRPDGGQRPPRAGETVRYSANSPRPPRINPALVNTPPAQPEVGRIRSNRGEVAPKAVDTRRVIDEDEIANENRKKGAANLKAVSRTKGEPKRREGRLTLQDVVGDDEGAADRMRSLASVRRAREREREKRKGSSVDQARVSRDVIIPDIITVQELSNRMAMRAVDIIKFLMKQGMMLKMNDVIDTDTAELVASEFGHTVRRVSESDVEEGFISAEDHDDATLPRAPVVAVMGHVDHGKTSLLDAMRKTSMVSGEAGGITQHIGAYQVRVGDERITVLDTPGHAAFSAMRARGATVTDIVILVVAADDGVMPQTIEAINHARAAKTPMIVAINKMDKPSANPQNIINGLLQHEVVIESLGGDVQAIEVSAKTGMGLDKLLEGILLQAELMDLRANPDRSAEGVVVESKLDKGRGAVATVLIKRGTLNRGDIIVAGASWGRVRALINERGEQRDGAGPSEPVEILGLNDAPDPGEALAVVESEARAREITEYRQRLKREKTVAPATAVSLSDMMTKLADKKTKELQIIIKTDVQGSAEAIQASLEKLSTDEVRARVIHSQAGAITESDVQLAKSANAPIIGFNVRAVKQARDLAEREGVEIRYYSIIYDLIDDIKSVMSGMLSPTLRETFLGNAEILEIFDISKIGKVAGCRVTEGKVVKGAKTRIIRDNVVIQEMGTLHTLKRFKDDVNEVVVGQECGMSFKDYQDIKKGDLIECFTVEEIKRSL
jgi:translation initiation factor IF-2